MGSTYLECHAVEVIRMKKLPVADRSELRTHDCGPTIEMMMPNSTFGLGCLPKTKRQVSDGS